MRPRDILARNVSRLMEASEDLRTIQALHKRSGISNGTVDRIRRGVVSAGVDQLEALARAFDVAPWELLLPPDAREQEAARELLRVARRLTSAGTAPNVVHLPAQADSPGGLRKTTAQKRRPPGSARETK